jgi:starch synthase
LRVASLDGKEVNKRALLEEMALPFEPDVPLFGMVSRFTEQKGIDLVVQAASALIDMPARLVAIGTGQREIEEAMVAAARLHPRHIAVRIVFDEGLAHRVEAGADVFLMPSRFEPCGLNQMYSQRYGTPPLARATGGLADTIVDANETSLADGSASGFLFAEATVTSMMSAVRRAAALYQDQELWRGLQRNAMARDFSWKVAAAEYAALYDRLARELQPT